PARALLRARPAPSASRATPSRAGGGARRRSGDAALRLARRSDRLDRPSGAALLPISRTPGAVGPGRLSRPRRAGAALLRLGGKALGLGRLDGSASRRGGRARGFFPGGGT